MATGALEFVQEVCGHMLRGKHVEELYFCQTDHLIDVITTHFRDYHYNDVMYDAVLSFSITISLVDLHIGEIGQNLRDLRVARDAYGRPTPSYNYRVLPPPSCSPGDRLDESAQRRPRFRGTIFGVSTDTSEDE